MESINLFCDLCKITFRDKESEMDHLLGKNHQLALHNAHLLNKKRKSGIFVTGFPNLVSKDKVKKFFEEFGPVISVHVGEGSRFAIIEYKDESAAQKLIQKKYVDFMGKSLSVKPRILKEVQFKPVETDKSEQDCEQIIENLKLPTDFNTQVQILLSKLQPNQELQMQKYTQLCRDLENALQNIFPGCKVYPFGSTITGLNFKNSDVDVYVLCKPPTVDEKPLLPAQMVTRARNALPRSRMFNNIIAITKAKTPIVKCVHILTNVSCDFNFKSMLGVCNSYLIKYYLGLDKNLRNVIIILKYWCRIHELAGNNGRFTNYALTMLLIFYLQQEPYLLPGVVQMQRDEDVKNMQEGWNGGFKPVEGLEDVLHGKSVQEILHGFFDFYLNFDYNLNIICPYLGRVIPKTDFLKIDSLPDDDYLLYKINITNVPPLQIDTPICIQDPFEHNHNISKTVSSKVLEEFISLCKAATSILECNATKNNILYKLFTDEPECEVFKCSETKGEFKLSMGSVLAYLEQQVAPEIDDKSSEIRRLWYDTVNKFFISVLLKILKLEVQVMKTDMKSKAIKIEGQSDIHENEFVDSVSFHCKGRHNLWAARKAVARDLDLSNIKDILTKEAAITDYICDVLCKNIVLTEPIVELTVTMNARETPIQMEFIFSKISAQKGCFKSLVMFCRSKLPQWFRTYERELNEGLKKITETEKT